MSNILSAHSEEITDDGFCPSEYRSERLVTEIFDM
jgi:hypothetical protein